MNERLTNTSIVSAGNQMSDCPYIDPAINDILDDYQTSLSNGRLAEFKSISDRDAKIDLVCWELAKSETTFKKAVNLRSLFALRSMDDASRNDPDEWSYQVPVMGNEYWQGVDKGIAAYLHKYADSFDNRVEAEEFITDSGMTQSRQKVATLNGRSVLRQTLRAQDSQEPHHVAYTIEQA